MKPGGEIEGRNAVKEALSAKEIFEQRLKNQRDGHRHLPGGAEL